MVGFITNFLINVFNILFKDGNGNHATKLYAFEMVEGNGLCIIPLNAVKVLKNCKDEIVIYLKENRLLRITDTSVYDETTQDVADIITTTSKKYQMFVNEEKTLVQFGFYDYCGICISSDYNALIEYAKMLVQQDIQGYSNMKNKQLGYFIKDMELAKDAK